MCVSLGLLDHEEDFGFTWSKPNEGGPSEARLYMPDRGSYLLLPQRDNVPYIVSELVPQRCAGYLAMPAATSQQGNDKKDEKHERQEQQLLQ